MDFSQNATAEFKWCLTGIDSQIRAESRRMMMEHRKFPRVETCNLISYLSIMENGEITDQSIGKALNISQGGIHLESPRLILSEHVSLMSVDLDNNLIEIKGTVVYSKENGSGMIGYGIRFQGQHNENIQFATKLIKVFHYRKHEAAVNVEYNGAAKMRLSAG